MRNLASSVLTVFLGTAALSAFAAVAHAQSSTSASAAGSAATSAMPPASAVPPLVRFSGVAKELNGSPLTTTTGITFLIYTAQEGGSPLWLETQNVQPDSTGQYSVLLGATRSEGLPSALFASGEARWLGVQLSGQPEQTRVLLLSVPYAMQAANADTVGGLPASAFLLATPANAATISSTTAPTAAMQAAAANGVTADATPTGSGTVGNLSLWTTASNLGNANIFQSSGGFIGINNPSPQVTLDVVGNTYFRGGFTIPAQNTATATTGYTSHSYYFVASSFNSTSGTAENQTFQWQAEPEGNNTPTPSGLLNLRFGEGTASPLPTGFGIASNGIVNFASGQTFPGTSSLTGANTFIGNQTVTGTVTANGGSGVGLVASTTSEFGTAIQATGPTTGISAFATAATGSVGVFGGAPSVGVYGFSQSASNTGSNRGEAGVWGDTGGASGQGYIGVLGTADDNSAGGFFNNGTYNTLIATNAGSGNAIKATAGSGYGVQGASTNVGVYGSSSATSGVTAGVLGTNQSPAGYGVWGQTTTVFSTTHAGVAGTFASGISATGSTYLFSHGAGVWGDGGNDSGTGVFATADGNSAGEFFNNSNADATLFLYNGGTGGTGAVLEAVGSSGSCSMSAGGDLGCTGKVITAADVESGTRKVALYSVQSPENWFEDFGSGALSNGSATVTLDPTFAQTVNTGTEYHVFLTPKGDCKGLYVANESAAGFEIRELGGGNSSVAFDYRIVAKRAGFENVRLADVTTQLKKTVVPGRRSPAQPSAAPNPAAAKPLPATKIAIHPKPARVAP